MQSEKVKAGIRQCLVRLEPAIFAYKRPPNIETALAFLEDMDEGAGGCDAFRGWLMTSLEASVRAMVRAEVQQQCRYARLLTILFLLLHMATWVSLDIKWALPPPPISHWSY